MKGLILALLMGTSVVAFASVVPEKVSPIKVPSITRANLSKQKIVVKEQPLDQTVGSGVAVDAKRYEGVMTMDNIKAIENMSRLMQDNPNAFFNRASASGKSELGSASFDRRKLGTNEIVEPYIRSKETDDPAEKFASLRVPELTGSFEEIHSSKEELKTIYEQALQQMENIGKKRLGEKQVSLQMPLTMEDIEEFGLDKRRLPKDIEATLKKQAQLMKEARTKKLEQAQEKKEDAGSSKKVQSTKEQKTTQGSGATKSQQTQKKTGTVKTNTKISSKSR